MKPELVADGDTIRIHIPMQLKRRGGRKEIIMPDGWDDAQPLRSEPQAALVLALARAHRWQEMLDSGKVGSIAELAERLSVDPSYVGRILRLTLLAPDIVEAVLAGREPSGMSLRKLTKNVPTLWEEQRERLRSGRI